MTYLFCSQWQVCVRVQQEVQCVLQDELSGDLAVKRVISQRGEHQVRGHLKGKERESGAPSAGRSAVLPQSRQP